MPTFREWIEEAARRRAGLFGDETDAFRLFDGAGDGMAGLFIDNFAGRWLAQTLDRDPPETLAEACDGLCRSLWWKALAQEDKMPPRWLRGERDAEPFPIRENGCAFLVDFQAGYSQGLFLDQRLNRAEVARRAGQGMEILNCFAYTCGFSVVAAARGAHTVSVDLSTRALDWGKSNFERNGLDFSAHEYWRGDVADALKRFARRGRRFQGVILDPPTFARNQKGRVFRAEKDFGRLAALAAKTVAGGGWVLCCSNCRTLEEAKLAGMLRGGFREAGRRIVEMRPLPMPPEYRDAPYLKSFWIELA